MEVLCLNDYIGVIKLDNPLYCRKEVSGAKIKSRIAGCDVLLIIPSIPDTYNGGASDLKNGDLVVSGDLFKGQVNWGMVMNWPDCIFSVNELLCYFSSEKSTVENIYEDFPRWKEKLNNLQLIDAGNYIIPSQKTPAILRSGGFDDGLQIFAALKGERLQYIPNHRSVEPITLHFVESEEAYTLQQVSDLLTNTGSTKEITLAYELLITAYQAFSRHDFRSAVILGGTAVEQSILKRLRLEYSSNTKFRKAKNNLQHSTLNGRFKWLAEKNIPVPISDFKKTIIDVRNDAAHDGIWPSHSVAKQCLENCKTLIETFCPGVLDD